MSSRYLNTIETVMANNHAVYMGTSQAVTLLYLNRKIPALLLQEAFSQYCQANPLLLAKLAIQNKKWCLQKNVHPLPNFEVYKLEEVLTNLDFILESEVNNILDHTKILTKLTLIYLTQNEGCLLVLTQHHAIMDTYSAKKILSDVINSLSRIDVGLDFHHFPSWQPIEKCKSLNHELITKNASDNDFISALKKICNPSPCAYTSVDTWIVNAAQMYSLVEYANILNTKLNSLLTILLSMGVMDVLKIHQIKTYSAVTYRKSDKLFSDFGCLLDVVNINIKSWDIDDSTRRFDREMNFVKNSMESEIEKTSQILADDKRQIFSSQKAISLCEGLGFTNSGRIDRLQLNNDLKILAYRSIANRTSGALLCTFHISFHEGNLIISAVSSQLILDKEKIKLFIEAINSYFNRIQYRVKNKVN